MRFAIASTTTLLALSCLAGCGVQSVPTPTLAPHQPLPATVWACPAQPQPPQDGSDDAALADWVTDLATAGQGCRDQLKIAHDIVEGK